MNEGKYKIQQFGDDGWVDIVNGFEALLDAEQDMKENEKEYSCGGRHELRIVPVERGGE